MAVEEIEEAGPFKERVAALDIGKAGLVACLRVPADTPRKRRQEVSEWDTMTGSLLDLADHLLGEGVELVVMEATGDYWRSPFYVLEAAGLCCWLVNARHVKNLPGRAKTDKLDAVWLCKVAERGMCAPSFVPAAPQRELRLFTRYRSAATRERTRTMQRVEKLLEDTGLKLSVVVSDIFGVSGRAMLAALVAGERDPVVLADLARGRMRPKKAELERALRGRFEDHHAMLLRMMLGHVDRLTADIATLDTKIAEVVAAVEGEARPRAGSGGEAGPAATVDPATGEILTPGGAAAAGDATTTRAEAATATTGGGRLGPAEHLAEIPGISLSTAHTIVAEVGADVSAFPTPGHLTSWAGLAPKDRASAGKSKRAKTAKGNAYLAGALGQAVLSLARTQTFYGARYRRVRAGAGPQKAIVAVSRSILTSIWHLLDDPDARYRELGADYHEKRKDTKKQVASHVRRLERLGFQVALTPVADQPEAA